MHALRQSFTAPLLCLLLLSLMFATHAHADDGVIIKRSAAFAQATKKAEQYFKEKSYKRAKQAFMAVEAAKFSQTEQDYLTYRRLESSWREATKRTRRPNSRHFKPIVELRKHAETIRARAPRDRPTRLWTEMQIAIGDAEKKRNYYNRNTLTAGHRAALDWWAGSTQIELARKKYLGLVLKHVTNDQAILAKAASIATHPSDIAFTHLRLGTVYAQRGDQRALKTLKTALAQRQSSTPKNSILYQLGYWYEHYGLEEKQDNGRVNKVPDYVNALRYYRKAKSASNYDSRVYRQSASQIKAITSPSVQIHIANAYHPEAMQSIPVTWRNVGSPTLKFYPINLNQAVSLGDGKNAGNWLNTIKLNSSSVRTVETSKQEKRKHLAVQETIDLKQPLPMGAYVVVASANGVKARAFLQVSSLAINATSDTKATRVWVVNSITGEPQANASVTYRERLYLSGKYLWRKRDVLTDQNGLVEIMHGKGHTDQHFISAKTAIGQAWTYNYRSSHNPTKQVQAKLYVYTDRPTYRPGQKAQWKLIARQFYNTGKYGEYQLPQVKSVRYKVVDARGKTLREDIAELNAYGAAHGEFELNKDMALGMTRIEFRMIKNNQWIGSANLFTLEEYKRPEFKVSIKPEKPADGKQYVLGDEIKVDINARYYFGAPVTQAEAELVIYRTHHYHRWQWPNKYPWYDQANGYNRGHYNTYKGGVLKRVKLKTDDAGKLQYSLKTDRNGSDQRYTIEVRLRDSSRREVTASTPIIVSHKPYYAYLKPDNNVYLAGATATLNFKLMDANKQPVSAKGTLTVSKGEWQSDWVDAFGKVHALNDDACKCFKPRKYMVYNEVLKQKVSIEQGALDHPLLLEKTGHYKLTWIGEQVRNQQVSASTQVWVTTDQASMMNYQVGDLQLVINKKELQLGKQAHALLLSSSPNRYVMFEQRYAGAGHNLGTADVLYMQGNSKLISFTVNENMVPGFSIATSSVLNDQFSQRSVNIAVAPEHRFLNVNIEADKDSYLPREKGKITVRTTDRNGKPVSADVSIAVIDESVYAIQQPLAGDIRQFFYGQKSRAYLRNQNSLNQLRYIRPEVLALREQAADFRLGKKEQARNRRAENKQVQPSPVAMAPSSVSGGLMDKSANTETLALGRSVASFDDVAEAEAEEDEDVDGEPAPEPGGFANDGPSNDGKSAVIVRHDFRETAVWVPSVITDKDGFAETEITFPDSLTQWRLVSKAINNDHQVGSSEGKTQSKQPLIARLQAPRFLIGSDLVTISGVFNNNTDQAMRVSPQLIVKGARLIGEDVPHTPIEVTANGQARYDWQVKAKNAGTMTISLLGKTVAPLNGGQYAQYSDAMRKQYPVYAYGMEQQLAESGKLSSKNGLATVTLNLPQRRRAGTTSGIVQVSPSIAITMLDAMPYLIDYPYGCTEQTMSRFLPTAIVANTLAKQGIARDEILGRSFGGISQQYKKDKLSKKAKNLAEMDAMLTKGFKRLLDHHNGDGGWGWWKASKSDDYMTAYVVWGLTLAQQQRIKSPDAALNSRINNALSAGRRFLRNRLADKNHHKHQRADLRAWMAYAIASEYAGSSKRNVSNVERVAADRLWKQRDDLSAQGRAMLALTVHAHGNKRRANILLRNLEDGANIDNTTNQSIVMANQSQTSNSNAMPTAYWGKTSGWYYWSKGAVESTSWVLMALSTIDKNHHLVTPAMNWLVKNRRGAQWNNTRDSAIALLALNHYLSNTKELNRNISYQVLVNGKIVANNSISAKNMLSAPSQHAIDGGLLRSGKNTIEIRRTAGSGPLYFMTQANFFTEEPRIKSAGHELYIHRQYLELHPTPTLLKGVGTRRQQLHDQAKVNSGHRVEVVMLIEAKNDYSYVLIEDFKPAGLEATLIKSGSNVYMRKLTASGVKALKAGKNTLQAEDYAGGTTPVYQELRDQKVANFVDHVPQGYWELRYEMRAETPGTFNALPAKAEAMYIPEIKANSTNHRLQVIDK